VARPEASPGATTKPNGADPFPFSRSSTFAPRTLVPGASAACPGLTVMSSNNLPIYPRWSAFLPGEPRLSRSRPTASTTSSQRQLPGAPRRPQEGTSRRTTRSLQGTSAWIRYVIRNSFCRIAKGSEGGGRAAVTERAGPLSLIAKEAPRIPSRASPMSAAKRLESWAGYEARGQR